MFTYRQTSQPRTSVSGQFDADDEPPPLPSVPPPPLDIAKTDSIPDDHFPSPPPHLKPSVSVPDVSASNRSSPSEMENSREDLIRKRMEFLGLKPEDSEEYKVMLKGQ
jgi:hypothetical protein